VIFDLAKYLTTQSARGLSVIVELLVTYRHVNENILLDNKRNRVKQEILLSLTGRAQHHNRHGTQLHSQLKA